MDTVDQRTEHDNAAADATGADIVRRVVAAARPRIVAAEQQRIKHLLAPAVAAALRCIPDGPSTADGVTLDGAAVRERLLRAWMAVAAGSGCPSRIAHESGAGIGCRQVGPHTLHSNLGGWKDLVTWVSGDDREYLSATSPTGDPTDAA